MSKRRTSIAHAEHTRIAIEHCERIARDIAFEAGASLEKVNESIFIITGSSRELLVEGRSPKEIWRQAMHAMGRMYPHLARSS
jgi:hypothetical protein